MINCHTDTIVAVSTARGVGAIAIVRMSGSESLKTAARFLQGKRDFSTHQPGKAFHGYFVHPNDNDFRIIDEVVALRYLAPESYTGEDMVEIFCHGSPLITREIVHACIEGGARLADPGEFTKRAFLSGKMDLLQAESVADLINAQTLHGLRYSISELTGILSERLIDLRELLKKKCAYLELELDFSDEDVEFLQRDDLLRDIDSALHEIESLIKSFTFGKLVREGAHTVIVGKPNAGKSSILNRLLQQDRAIVSHVPGTTRDHLEESLDIDGYLFRVTDTAGLRQTDDPIENKGVQRTESLMKSADIILLIVDISESLENEDVRIIRHYMEKSESNRQSFVLVLNKSDLHHEVDVDFLTREISVPIQISAKTGDGFDLLEQKLVTCVSQQIPTESTAIIGKLRHKTVLQKARDHLLHAKGSTEANLSGEFIALDLRASLDAIGQLTGEVTSEDILNDIFADFCVGK
jgi:tRNA modification GTPase